LVQDKKIATGNVIERRALKLFGLNMPITFETEPKACEDITYEKDLSIYHTQINGMTLPATVYREAWTEYRIEQVELTEEEALQQALKIHFFQYPKMQEKRKFQELAEKQTKGLKEEDRIISTDISYEVQNGRLILYGTSVWEENIAQESEIYMDLF